jgi:hypothetical protein
LRLIKRPVFWLIERSRAILEMLFSKRFLAAGGKVDGKFREARTSDFNFSHLVATNTEKHGLIQKNSKGGKINLSLDLPGKCI